MESTESLSPDSPWSTDLRSYDLKRVDGSLDVAWTEVSGDHHQIHVKRLSGDKGSWTPVGDVVNADPAADAQDPSLAAGPDGAPWIAWSEAGGDGVRQVRVARYDGSDWIEQAPTVSDPADGSARGPRLVFMGDRPYIVFMQDASARVARLAKDGASWLVSSRVPISAASGADAAVIGGSLYVGTTSGGDTAVVMRLLRDGRWEQVGGAPVNGAVRDEWDRPRPGDFNQLVDYGGAPVAMWSTYEAWPKDNSSYYYGYAYLATPGDRAWDRRSVELGFIGGSLRTVGGYLYASSATPPWISGPADISVVRLDQTLSSYQYVAPLIHTRDAGAVLSSLDGVPYLAWTPNYGGNATLAVWRMPSSQVPTPIGPDDGEGSGPGADPVLPSDERCPVALTGTPGDDTLSAGERGTDIRALAGDDLLTGGEGNDCLRAGDGTDALRGGAGLDWLFGGRGSDRLFGGAGSDALNGGRGADRLRGGPGDDVFRAGPGDDVIDAVDGRGELVMCGDGNDTARADLADVARDCERVTVGGPAP